MRRFEKPAAGFSPLPIFFNALRRVIRWLESDKQVSTDRFIDYLYSQRLASNVDLSEVADVELSDLKGIDDVIRGLEANVVVPLENDELVPT